jgi:glutamate-ammonia-ligase adenylyltransferase
VTTEVQLKAFLEAIPGSLRDGVLQHWENFQQSLVQQGIEYTIGDPEISGLFRVWAVSEFAALLCIRQPRMCVGLLESGAIQRTYPADAYTSILKKDVGDIDTPEALGRYLRQHRQREMLRIAWRDIVGLATTNDTMSDLSALADACLQTALEWLHRHLEEELGIPHCQQDKPQQMVVLAMGKLGAGELNFSSDIDLIFAFPEPGQTQGGRRTVSNDEYFTRLGQALIKALDEKTADGFVFRIDMRLRPFGQSGALVSSFQAMEHYYQVHGRDWERYAFIKARVAAGDFDQGAILLETLRPFVFRRYLDYGAFEALREMKQMVEAEVKRKGMANHVKLGAGGIREVEFIGQAYQLVRGGRDPALRQREIQKVLAYLGERDYLPAYVIQQLQEAYLFLRNTEHRLQEFRDEQTHRLPEDAQGRARLAFAMDYESWDEFLPALRGHMSRVHSRFEQIFAAPQIEHKETGIIGLVTLWLNPPPEESDAIAILEGSGYQDAPASWARLGALRTSHCYQGLSREGRKRMDKLIPLMLGAVAHAPDPDAVLQQLIALTEAIARRSAYLSLLIEHPVALSQLVRLVGASPWIARYVTQHPLLLDELLDPRTLFLPPNRPQLESELERRFSLIDKDDLEQVMDVLRQFKQSSTLRVAAADVVEAVPLMQVSDNLTWLAEVILQATLEQAWRYMVQRHGYPSCAKGDEEKGFAIIAYGKLGGIELGYGSDLDLVFIHGSGDPNAMSNGSRPVVDEVFFARLGQRMIHILTARTSAGVLYEVDMRLRPSGSAGLLVVSLAAFEEYQKNKAWTWEHQALVRARALTGDSNISQGFERVRREVIALERDSISLRRDIVEMRQKMRDALLKTKKGEFDLKHGIGGIADIEFMVQYCVLNGTHNIPALAEFTDNIRLLEGFARHGIMSAEDAAELGDAYRAYRAEVHRLTLQEQPAIVTEKQFKKERANVTRVWRQLFETDDV